MSFVLRRKHADDAVGGRWSPKCSSLSTASCSSLRLVRGPRLGAGRAEWANVCLAGRPADNPVATERVTAEFLDVRNGLLALGNVTKLVQQLKFKCTNLLYGRQEAYMRDGVVCGQGAYARVPL